MEEVHGPEQKLKKESPESTPFNVDMMTDEQIVTIFHRLVELELPNEDDAKFIDGLVSQLTTDVHDLVSRHPERVRNLVQQCVASDEWGRHEFAAYIAPALLGYDYEFTRDTLISIDAGEAYGRIGNTVPSDAARHQARLLMRDRLTREQVSDFQAHFARYHPELPYGPALPGER